MKAKLLIACLPLVVCALYPLLASDEKPTREKPADGLLIPERTEYATLEDLKRAYPHAINWTEFEHSGKKYVFFGNEMLSFGSSYIVFRGWELMGEPHNVWINIMFADLRGLYKTEIVVDARESRLRIRAIGNNTLNGNDVLTLDLRGLVP